MPGNPLFRSEKKGMAACGIRAGRSAAFISCRCLWKGGENVFKKLFRWIFSLLGMACGAGIFFAATYLIRLIPSAPGISQLWYFVLGAVCVAVTGLIFFLIAPHVQRGGEQFTQELDDNLKKVPIHEFICGTLGLIVGLLIAFLISSLWRGWSVPVVGTVLSVIVYIFFGYTGIYIARKKANDIMLGVRQITSAKGPKATTRNKAAGQTAPKILDTSVIIDGRIADIMKTGFIEGRIVIPEFVLVELRHIADSSDSLKRNRGRRGLDVLNKIQSQYGVEIYNTDSEKSLNAIPEVDAKLLQLALNMNGKVVTNDYNLNKVASIKGVSVLNINELANTLKPVVLPGEEMELTPIKEGKENSQALAYLDDGTMIVVEGGRRHIGHEITTVVTSVLQTSAGRMIFAKPKHSGETK